jgi:hypothetical protein
MRIANGPRFKRGDIVSHRDRPDILGRVRKQHKPVYQYEVEWECLPYRIPGGKRVTHEWESDLRVKRTEHTRTAA